MKNLWQKLTGRESPSRPNKEWIAITTKLSGGEFGSHQERQEIRSFGRRLAQEIQRCEGATFDGDEFGSHEASLYVRGPDADQLFDLIEPLLRSWPTMKGGHAIKRYGELTRSERVDF